MAPSFQRKIMSRTIVAPCYIYDAEVKILDLKNMKTLMDKPDEKFALWYTKQPWRGEVIYGNGEFHFNSFLAGQHMRYIHNADIFALIKEVNATDCGISG